MSDVIAAIATGGIRSAIGILRLSGAGAGALVEQVFTPASGKPLTSYPPHTLVYGTLTDRNGAPIDQCLATYSLAPASYTGEDTAELQCHGSPAVLAAGLEALFAVGVRQAKAGEFTRRAFLNHRLDLVQAEAVIDLIDAQTPAAARNAVGQLQGAMSRSIHEIYDRLTDLMAHFCVVLDYPDEDLDAFESDEILHTVEDSTAALERLLSTYRRGRQLTQGIRCAIVGKPNAGKSSLLNALVGYERAIVTEIPGTTRDTIEETITVGDTLLRLVDTAGFRQSTDRVEQLGVERSRRAMEEAELVLVVLDGTQPLDQEVRALCADAARRPHVIYLQTKADQTAVPLSLEDCTPILISSVTGEGLPQLESAIAAAFPAGDVPAGGFLTNARQAEAAERALTALRSAHEGLSCGMTPDAVLSDVEAAMNALGELTGAVVTEDITGRIFSRFCVGK